MLAITRSKSPLKPQGLLAPEILVTLADRQAADPNTLPDGLIQFCDWCIEEAWLVRDEVQPDVWPIYHATYYIAQVNNGGHGQFAANSAMKSAVLGDIEDGLERLDLDQLLTIFRRFRIALERDAALKAATMEGAGFGDTPEFIREIDAAFFASPDPDRFPEQASCWLKNASTVLSLTPRELRARQAMIVASNTLLVRRRLVAARPSPWKRLTGAAVRLWDKAGYGRPGETVLDAARRTIAANSPSEWQFAEDHGRLILAVMPAVQDEDDKRVDQIFAEFRELHARYVRETTSHWPDDIRMYASKLHYAGRQLGRVDLLKQAADAFGHASTTGRPYHYDPGFDWRSLGQALVELARPDRKCVPDLAEAVDAFTKALTIDAADPKPYQRVSSLLGRAEACLVVAANGGGLEPLDAARAALVEARPLLGKDDRSAWEVVNAELLSLQPRGGGTRDRARAVSQLEVAIAWEMKNDGDPRANRIRLERVQKLHAALAET
jgi:hypothetical protein